MELLLVRHGETDWNREGRIQGWIDVGLNDEGREQARDAAAEIPDDQSYQLVSSPLRRATETAEILAGELSVDQLLIRPEFKELNQGHWNGLRGSWLLKQDLDRYEQWTDSPTSTSPPGGESLRQIRDRVAAGLGFLGEFVASPCVLVAHKVVNSLVDHIVNATPLETVLDTLAGNAEVRTFSVDRDQLIQ